MLFLFFLCALCTNSLVTALNCGRQNYLDFIQLPTPDHLTSPYHADILKSLNEKLLEKCDEYYDFNYMNVKNKNLDHIKYYINLFDTHYNYAEQFEEDKHFVYAGDINVFGDKTEAYVNAANFTLNTNSITDAEEYNTNTSTQCENYFQTIKIDNTQAAKLVTKHLKSTYNDLFNFITSIQYLSENNITSQASCMPSTTKPEEFKYVLVCSDTMSCFDIAHSLRLKIIFRDTGKCEESMEKFNGSMLAVIAPKPFKMNYETLVPAIFYTSYTDSEHESQFPNSLNLVSEDHHMLKHAFLKFIRRSRWRRVAIISDFAPNSITFEKELTELFYDEGILHKVVYGDNDAEFGQAIQKLRKVDTRIVIANVNEKNALKLATMRASVESGLVFLFRTPPIWNNHLFGTNERLISISLGVANQDYCQYDFNCNGILEGLRILTKSHSNLRVTTKTSKKYFYRKLKENMETLLERKYEVTIARSPAPNSIISTMYYNPSGILNTKDYRATFNKAIQDEKPCSYYKSNNFDKPCDPMPILYIMLVVMLFAILVLILTCYFHNTSPLNSTIYEQL